MVVNTVNGCGFEDCWACSVGAEAVVEGMAEGRGGRIVVVVGGAVVMISSMAIGAEEEAEAGGGTVNGSSSAAAGGGGIEDDVNSNGSGSLSLRASGCC